MEVGGIRWPSPLLKEAWESGIYPTGVTEPWVQQVVADLLVASGQRVVLELGSYLGLTTLWLALVLEAQGGGTLNTVELEKERVAATSKLFAAHGPLKHTSLTFIHDNTLNVLPSLKDNSVGFAWVDDCHEAPHVAEELKHLKPKMVQGGLICMHDVSGPLGLDMVCRAFGGYVLHFPRLGPAGGLGIIQC